MQESRIRNSIIAKFARNTTFLVAFFGMVAPAKSIDCSEMTAISTTADICHREDGEIFCLLTKAVTVSVPPHGQTGCMTIKNSEGQVLGSIEIKFMELAMRCTPVSHHFTRDFELTHFDVKRCAAEGSCRGERCAEIQYFEKIPELEIANSAYGYTFCTESCGFWSCGCGLPTSGCLFYRVFAKPTTDNSVYEIFRCPYWVPQLPLEIKITTQNFSETLSPILSPGLVWHSKKDNLHLTLISQIYPPTSLASMFFITNYSHTALLEEEWFENSKILSCPNLDSALAFKCKFPINTCTCTPAETRVNCACPRSEFKLAYAKNLLPLASDSMTLTSVENTVEASLLRDTSVQLQVYFENFPLSIAIDTTTCSIEPISLYGCYRCSTGSEFKFSCTSSNDGALAYVSCPSSDFTVTCNRENSTNIKRLAINTAVVDEKCSVSCSGGKTYFKLAGKLSFVNSQQEISWSNIANGEVIPQADYSFLLGFIFGSWWKAFLFLSILVLALMLWFFCFCSPLMWIRTSHQKIY